MALRHGASSRRRKLESSALRQVIASAETTDVVRYARVSVSTSAGRNLLVTYVGALSDDLRQGAEDTTASGQVIVNQDNDATDSY